MTTNDFKNIEFFTEKEITDSGSHISMVQFVVIHKLDNVRRILGQPISILFNGLTSGNHKDPAHPAGLAVDFEVSGNTDYYMVFKACLTAGFWAIGIYWNGQAYSYHAGHDAEGYRFWAAVKAEPGAPEWTYCPLIVDPATLSLPHSA